jgi:uncharacterized protein YydD (DUF2326 family)
MFLKKLTVSSQTEIIRQIIFHKGVNLIVDASKTEYEDTGNSVGKTTVLRVIDFCLGSEGKDIYTDQESGKKNDLVFNYLSKNKVTFILVLELNNGKSVTIERGFPMTAEMKINGFTYTSDEKFRAELKDLIFDAKEQKPSLRNLMPKFVRKDVTTMSNTLNFLHATTTKDDYESIFYFLFGFENQKIIREKSILLNEIKSLTNKLKVYKNSQPPSHYKQLLLLLEKEISEIENRLKNFELNETHTDDTNKLKDLALEISKHYLNKVNTEAQLELNRRSLEELGNNKTNIDTDSIKYLYQEAQIFIPNLQTKFEELLVFHNQMIVEKVEFIKTHLAQLTGRLSSINYEIKELNKLKTELFKTLNDKGSFADLNRLQRDISEKHSSRGSLLTTIKRISETALEIETKEKAVKNIETEIKNYQSNFEDNLSEFNAFYSSYSEMLYGEKSILSHDLSKSKFTINNVGANVGTGEKILEIAAFDLAYISFVDKLNISRPKFILHNNIEQVDDNKVKSLFDIANSINGQYIVAILRDKLSTFSTDFISEHQIIELSQNSKFFNI